MKEIMFFLFVLMGLNSCGIYSFEGTSISEDVKTYSVSQFENNALSVNPNLSEILGEKLKEKFLRETKLTMVQYGGDVNFVGVITDYKTNPVNVQGDQQAAQTRLTITVKVNFENKKQTEQSYESSFTQYADFSNDNTLTDVEDMLIEEITKQLVEDIFNKAFNNW